MGSTLKVKAFLCAALAGFVLLAHSEARAEPEGQSDAASLEHLTVTAQKREANIQKVPVSMDAFTGEQLEDRGVRNVDEMARFAPNVSLQRNSYENNLVIRGVAPTSDTLRSPAGVYIDDVPLPFNYMFNWDLYDLERVEVLRGPQGTTYGHNTESGLIKIITRQPGNTMRAKVHGELGFFDTGHGSVPSYLMVADASGPIVNQQLFLGLAGRFESSDGYMKNIYNDDESIGQMNRFNGRGTLRWTPARAWDIALVADILDTDDGDGFYRFTSGSYATDRNEVNYDYPETYFKQDGNGLNLRVKYQGKWFDMVSVSGRRYWHADSARESDMTPLPHAYGRADYKNTLLNQEFRFSSPARDQGPWKWLLGLYAFREKDEVSFFSNYYGLTKSDITILGTALFGQVTYTMFDKLHLTGGARLERLDQSGDQSFTAVGQQDTLSWDKDMDSQELLPRLEAAYDITPQVMAYASASKGYLSGDYRIWNNTCPEQFSYEPEFTWNYELGLKSSFWDDRVILNASVFYIDMQDKQVLEYSPEIMNNKLRNAAEAHSQGFELEVKARIAKGFEVFAGFGYTEAKIDDWLATETDSSGQVIQVDYNGKDLPDVPKYTYNLGLQYRHPIGFMGRVDFLGVGDYYNDATNQVKTDAYNLVNLRLGYESEHYDIILWAKNLFDQDYFTKKYDWGGAYMGYDAPPRMVGVSFTWRY
ncbi:hypothetical protein AAU61_05705 [Desulfocarbo indianensis]|nr:hypothetical protein AAU61_05705 [Desulfocarbo indianensis]